MLCLGFAVMPPAVSATTGQLPVAEAVSLQEVLVDVTQTNPEILEALNNYRGVWEERAIARSEYLPKVGASLSTGPEYTDGVITDDIEQDLLATTATLYARQNLYNGGRSRAFSQETDARILAAGYEVLNVANRVYLDTAEAYINVLKARELLEIARANVNTQEKIMMQVREKTESGFSRASDLYNSESRLALAKGSYVSRQQDMNQALVYFHKQFGRALTEEQFTTPHPAFQVPSSLQETIDVAFANHPALKVAEYNIETRKYTYEKGLASYRPTLDLELRGQYTNDTGGEEGDTSQAGAYVTLNYLFYDGGQRKGQKAHDYQAVRKEHQRSYIERRNVNETVRLAWNIKEAEDFKNEFLTQHVELSAKTLDAFKEEYSVGRRTLIDLLNMENEYTDAQLAMATSHYSRLVAQYRILQATGVLLEEHDTGLRDHLELKPMEENDRFADSEDFAVSRDSDEVPDARDQCDNSGAVGKVNSFGCDDAIAEKALYHPVTETELAPYIVPSQRQEN